MDRQTTTRDQALATMIAACVNAYPKGGLGELNLAIIRREQEVDLLDAYASARSLWQRHLKRAKTGTDATVRALATNHCKIDIENRFLDLGLPHHLVLALTTEITAEHALEHAA